VRTEARCLIQINKGCISFVRPRRREAEGGHGWRLRRFLTFTPCGEGHDDHIARYGLIAELIAAALLIVALTGLFVQRSKPWLVGVTMAFVILTVAATVVIASLT
jgi:hypothetical protein